MKRFTGLGLMIALGFLLSCGSQKDSTLSMSVSPDTSFILPGDDQPNCYLAKITGPRIIFPGISFNWSDANSKFYPAILKFTFKSTDLGGTVECAVQDGITSKFRDATSKSSTSFVTTNYFVKGDYELTDGCAIECGGISVVDPNKAFKISGEAKFVGYAINTKDGSQKPYSATATVFMQNLP